MTLWDSKDAPQEVIDMQDTSTSDQLCYQSADGSDQCEAQRVPPTDGGFTGYPCDTATPSATIAPVPDVGALCERLTT